MQSIEAENTRLTKRTEDLQFTIAQTQTDLNRLRTEHAEAQETIERLQDNQQNTTLDIQTHQQPSPPSTPHANSTTNNVNTIATLQANHAAEISSLNTTHATTLSTLRTAHADLTHKLRTLLSASETREADLRAELEHVTESQSLNAQEQAISASRISTLESELDRLNALIKAKDETAAAMDLRIAKSVEKREREWERRVELLLKEREKMGRALLYSWGEKEVPKSSTSVSASAGTEKSRERTRSKGKGEDKENIEDDSSKLAGGEGKKRQQGQGYRYKYVKRT
ncbi:hypothetical protein BJY04DRAFT_178867 [Aspergillus karnatakaensis]|uniref:putative spindle pole body associated protein SnaD n=1 Tax=Aspergillus karnatakaensis TaxID=1810916 RepID=UPI003CCCD6E7